MKGDGMTKRASLGKIMRKKLSDVTNMQTPKVFSHAETVLDLSDSNKISVDQLIAERMNLVRLITQRNKIIELSGAELKKLRVSLQNLQVQNWNLAQSNSQMLAELNLGRERVKALQHELMCKDALLKAKNTELEIKTIMASTKKTELKLGMELSDPQQSLEAGKTKANCQNASFGEVEKAAPSVAVIDDKPIYNNIRRAPRSQSLGPSPLCRRVEDIEKAESKRRCLRRKSARFKSHEKEPKENLFEIEDVKFPDNHTPDHSILGGGRMPLNPLSQGKSDAGLSQRSSLGRPLRKVAEKVQSYKEVPINVKMRRND